MADWALQQGEVVAALAGAVNVPRTAAAHTKGAWQQIVASMPSAVDQIIVAVAAGTNTGGTAAYLLDIGIGAASSEVVIVPDLHIDHARTIDQCFVVRLPIRIAAGERIAARVQDTVGSGTRTLNVRLTGVAGGYNAIGGVSGAMTAYGVNSGATVGTLVDSGATANSWGAWVELAASTSNPHSAMVVVAGSNNQTVATGIQYADLQIGIGASGSEVPIWQGYARSGNSTPNIVGAWTADVSIPAGSRIAARTRSTSSATAARNITLVVYGA